MNTRLRLENLDFLKGLSIYFVIVLHSLPIINSENNFFIDEILVNLSRFAVPCFFIISGYLSGEKAMKDKCYAIKIIKRILLLFAFWNLFYFVIPTNIDQISEFGYLKIKYWDFYQLIQNPVKVILQGFYGHLWFLESLALAFLYLIFASKTGPKPAFFIAALVYVLSVLAGGYSHTEVGVSIPFTSRNGPFVSAFFVMLGWYFSVKKTRVSSLHCILLTISGLSIQYLEYAALTSYYMRAVHYEFLFGTPIFATGIFLFFINLSCQENLVSFLGKHSLGIYVLHILVIDYTSSLLRIFGIDINYIIFVFTTISIIFMSLALSKLLALNKQLRYFIA